MEKKKIPIGVESFADLRENDYYYVDKSGLISELLESRASVNLFTRPRRFGKTLNMSMLQHFFDINTEKNIFDGLAVSKDAEVCSKYMGQHPVIFLSMKQVQGRGYQEAEDQLREAVSEAARKVTYLVESDKLLEEDKAYFRGMRMGKGNLANSLLRLCEFLYLHHGKKVVVLIDEYDVPLQKAEQDGYYRDMVKLISQFFGYSMKTNPYLEFAVITGCLRVSKESIFTGFNNAQIHTIADEKYDEWFGFTDSEVRELLEYYECSEYYQITREWYDGYLFGKEHVYCPWDVINWCYRLRNESVDIPQNFWVNTSSNEIIRRFAEMADQQTRDEMGWLIEEKKICKKLNLELTYDELNGSVENLWSVLFMTGYLTQCGREADGRFWLKLPNREIRNLFIGILNKWFQDRVLNDRDGLKEFFEALDERDPERLEECLNYLLEESVSFLDGGKTDEKENFYHGLILGMLKNRTGWITLSNREAGDGRLDLVAYPRRGKYAVILEFKYTGKEKELDAAANTALNQIDEKRYESYFSGNRPEELVLLGMAFCKKRCRVLMRNRD